jgi:hypothetical protein
MSKMKNTKFFELALEAGGSHYPGVGGALLEQYSGYLLDAVLKICEDHPGHTGRMIAEEIKQHFNYEQNTSVARF